MIADPEISAVFDRHRRLDILLSGIGSLEHDEEADLSTSGISRGWQLSALRRKGAVGDVLSYTFDVDGRFIPTGAEDRLIAIPLDCLVTTPYRIGLAVGPQKTAAIVGALRAGLFNILVTDSLAARAVLAEASPVRTKSIVDAATGATT